MAQTVRRAADSLSLRPFVESSADRDEPELLRARAAALGYLFVRGLADVSVVRALRRDILGLFADRAWLVLSNKKTKIDSRVTDRALRDLSVEESTKLQVEIQLLPSFAALRSDSSIARVLECVLGSVPRGGFGDVCRMVAPRMLDRTTPPHQDHFYTRGSTSQWTVWIPVGDCPAPLGGLVVLPRSHESGVLPHDVPIEDGRAIDVDATTVWHGGAFRCGDALMFNALTVHRARPNLTSDRVRLSVDYRYVGTADA